MIHRGYKSRDIKTQALSRHHLLIWFCLSDFRGWAKSEHCGVESNQHNSLLNFNLILSQWIIFYMFLMIIMDGRWIKHLNPVNVDCRIAHLKCFVWAQNTFCEVEKNNLDFVNEIIISVLELFYGSNQQITLSIPCLLVVSIFICLHCKLIMHSKELLSHEIILNF